MRSPSWPAVERVLPTNWVGAGFGGSLLVAAGGLMVGPPGPAGSRIQAVVDRFRPHGLLGGALGTVAVVAGLALLLAAWLRALTLVREGLRPQQVVKVAALWASPFLLGPPLFTRDPYSYAAQGRMVLLHHSPYHYGPAVLGASALLGPVDRIWRTKVSPYGPLFLVLDAFALRVSGPHVVPAVVLQRMLAVGGLVLVARFLPRLAAARGADPSRALLLGLCNPLVILHLVAGAHNDALMLGFLVAGLALAAERRPMGGAALCALGAAVKAPAAIAVLFIAIEAGRRAPQVRERVYEAARVAAAGAATFVAVTLASGLGWGWVGALGTPNSVRTLFTPTTLLADVVALLTGRAGTLEAVTHGIGLLAAAAAVAWLAGRVWRDAADSSSSTAWALLAIVLLGPVLQPWYVLWGLVVLVATGERDDLAVTMIATIALLLVIRPDGTAMPDVAVAATVMGALAVAGLHVTRTRPRLRAG